MNFWPRRRHAPGDAVVVLSHDIRFQNPGGGGQGVHRRVNALLVAQPTHVAEKFTGIPGVYVPLRETLRGFQAILDGSMDVEARGSTAG